MYTICVRSIFLIDVYEHLSVPFLDNRQPLRSGYVRRRRPTICNEMGEACTKFKLAEPTRKFWSFDICRQYFALST